MGTKTVRALCWLCAAMGATFGTATGTALQSAQSADGANGTDLPVLRISSSYVLLDVLVEERKTHRLLGNLEAIKAAVVTISRRASGHLAANPGE